MHASNYYLLDHRFQIMNGKLLLFGLYREKSVKFKRKHSELQKINHYYYHSITIIIVIITIIIIIIELLID